MTSQECQDKCVSSTTPCLFFTWASSAVEITAERYKCFLYSESDYSSSADTLGYVTGPRACLIDPSQNSSAVVDTRKSSILAVFLLSPYLFARESFSSCKRKICLVTHTWLCCLIIMILTSFYIPIAIEAGNGQDCLDNTFTLVSTC